MHSTIDEETFVLEPIENKKQNVTYLCSNGYGVGYIRS